MLLTKPRNTPFDFFRISLLVDLLYKDSDPLKLAKVLFVKLVQICKMGCWLVLREGVLGGCGSGSGPEPTQMAS